MDDLVRALGSAKQRYKGSLLQLERISDEIHQQRSEDLPQRTPCEGAEDSSLTEATDARAGSNLF